MVVRPAIHFVSIFISGYYLTEFRTAEQQGRQCIAPVCVVLDNYLCKLFRVNFHSPTDFSMNVLTLKPDRSMCGALSRGIGFLIVNPSQIGLLGFSVYNYCFVKKQLMFGAYGVVHNAFLNYIHILVHMVIKNFSFVCYFSKNNEVV